MIALAWWQGLLGGLGHVLAWLYSLIPNYGVAIILLTVGIRLILLPLGIKQIRSMQAMAALQPKLKQIQQKYKGNRAKQNEEMQKLYRDAGVNPLAGCLPLLLQLPVLIALYSVLRFPSNVGAPVQGAPAGGSHIPVASKLYDAIYEQSPGVHFLGTNLVCSAAEAGKSVDLKDKSGKPFVAPKTAPNAGESLRLDCGHGFPIRIPYYVLAVLMVATTYYQQRQMTRASPTPNQQQQALTRIMPLLFGVWGVLFPAGLVVYWTTSNLWQIGQQHFMLRAQAKQPAAGDGKPAQPRKPARQGWFGSLMERAQQQAEQTRRVQPSGGKSSGTTGSKPAGTTGSKPAASKPPPPAKGGNAAPPRRPTPSGGKNAGDRKKRRKR